MYPYRPVSSVHAVGGRGHQIGFEPTLPRQNLLTVTFILKNVLPPGSGIERPMEI